MEPRPLPPRTLLLRSDPGASASVPAAERACAEMAGPGVQGGKEVLRAGGHFKVLTIIEPRFLSLGYRVLSSAQCPPWRTCLFLACTPGRQGRRHVPLSDSVALSPALPEHSPRRPQSGRLAMAPAVACSAVGRSADRCCLSTSPWGWRVLTARPSPWPQGCHPGHSGGGALRWRAGGRGSRPCQWRAAGGRVQSRARPRRAHAKWGRGAGSVSPSFLWPLLFFLYFWN